MILVWDTETTGLTLHPQAPLDMQPHVIEFAGALLSPKTGKVVEKFDFLINPGIPIPEEASKINKITDETVKDKPSFAATWPKIAAVFDETKAAIAHNAPFDYSVLQFELARANLKHRFPAMLDTIGLYRAEFGYDPRLTDLYEHVMKKKLKQEHRAGSDVAALVEIVRKTKLWRVL